MSRALPTRSLSSPKNDNGLGCQKENIPRGKVIIFVDKGKNEGSALCIEQKRLGVGPLCVMANGK